MPPLDLPQSLNTDVRKTKAGRRNEKLHFLTEPTAVGFGYPTDLFIALNWSCLIVSHITVLIPAQGQPRDASKMHSLLVCLYIWRNQYGQTRFEAHI